MTRDPQLDDLYYRLAFARQNVADQVVALVREPLADEGAADYYLPFDDLIVGPDGTLVETPFGSDPLGAVCREIEILAAIPSIVETLQEELGKRIQAVYTAGADLGQGRLPGSGLWMFIATDEDEVAR